MKRRLIVLVFLSLILILSLTFVSAGFFNDLFKKVTGEVTSPLPVASTCGNGVCDAGETCSACSTDCRCSAGYICSNGGCVAPICTAETNAAFCSRLGKTCGSVSGTDNCGTSRTISNCGTCLVGQICSTIGQCVVQNSCTSNSTCNDNNTCTLDGCVNGVCQHTLRTGCCTSDSQCSSATSIAQKKCVNNVCVNVNSTCTAESNVVFCSRLGKICGNITNIDNCGVSRIVSCGICSSGQICSNGGCAKTASISCVDSDGGNDTYTKGNTSNPNTGVVYLTDVCAMKVYYGNNSQYETTTACSAGPDCFIGEAVCDLTNTNWEQKIIECPYGCRDGACLKSQNLTNQMKGCGITNLCPNGQTCTDGICVQTTNGTCVNSNTGSCVINITQILCTNSGGTWIQKSVNEIPECQEVCCVLGQDKFFVNQIECKNLAVKYNVIAEIRMDITSREVCLNYTSNPACGDGICSNGETCSTCLADCGCVAGYTCSNNSCIQITTTPVCSLGCSLNGRCYAFGYSKSGQYCSTTHNFVSQLDNNKPCSKNYECKSDVCYNSKCVSKSYNLFRGLLRLQ